MDATNPARHGLVICYTEMSFMSPNEYQLGRFDMGISGYGSTTGQAEADKKKEARLLEASPEDRSPHCSGSVRSVILPLLLNSTPQKD